MTADQFIDEAISTGQREGAATMDVSQRWIWLISEAEVFCDVEGVDSFFDKYAQRWILETADAFELVGATKIAAELRSVPLDAPVGDPRLDRLNSLITRRAGYSYESIRRVVEDRLQARV